MTAVALVLESGGETARGVFRRKGDWSMNIRFVRVALAIVGLVAVSGLPSLGQDEEEATSKLQIRNFDHLEFDTVTGTYFGVASFYTADDKVVFDDVKTKNETVTTELRLLMGGDRFQGGVVIPYHATRHDALGQGQSDVGDVRTHLKFIPVRKELFDVGAGLMLTFPGGSRAQGITTGKVGVLPFATGTAHVGPADLNGHIGYNFYNHDSSAGAPESILYGGSVKYPVLEMLGLRLELAGQNFTSGKDRNVASIQPGLDFLIEAGKLDLLLSAAGSYGLAGGTAGAKDGFVSRWGVNTLSGLSRGQWGAGMALGVLWN